MILPKSAYIPPHLRNRPATRAKADSVVGPNTPPTANYSPAVSDNSKTEHLAQLQSSPNGANHGPSSPPSPPTTRWDSREATPAQNGEWAGWDTPTSDVPAPPKKAESPQWPRGPRPVHQKQVWPKNRDMKYIPSGSDSEGGVSCHSNSNGDPNYDLKKITDWNGDWLPAPEQWSARKSFVNRHFGQGIEKWMNAQPKDCEQPILDTNNKLVSFRGADTLDSSVVKELAPRYWLQSKVDDLTLGEFWKELPKRAPDPLNDVDITVDCPWWERYENETSYYINSLDVPDAKIDPEDVENRHPNIFATTTGRLEAREKRELEQHRRMMARRNRPIPESKFPVLPVEDRRLRPAANVYIRPVQLFDARGIMELYNWYVENSIQANEFDARREEHIRNRINTTVQAGLPYLVAVARGNQPREFRGTISERIAGFISLDDYCDQSSMYRYTFEMELFVHPGYIRKGIGKCLLDRLLEMANTSYNARGGYEYINKFEYLKNGPSRVIKTILLNVHHEHGKNNQWVQDYLSSFKFVRCGHVSQVGFKLDKIVDKSIFQHHTTEIINASGRPTVKN